MKKIEVIQNILEANETIANRNQQQLDNHKVFTINIMSSPGGGKTSLILQTLTRLKGRLNIAVIEGDVASTVDAEKVQSEAKSVVQINTRNMPESCSLMAAMIESALKDMPLNNIDLLLIENVGNLICPSEFTLGEHKRVVISSLPEGDDIAAFRRSIEGLNPKAEVFQLSSKTGEGVEKWCSWVLKQVETNATKL
jgi:hydrogenase nickel incorporation protein HypB